MKWSFKGSLLFGLAGILWFSAIFRGAHDLWAACVVFFLTTSLVTVYAVRCWRQEAQTQIPFAPSIAAVLVFLWMSTRHAYDLQTTLLEAWGWTFAICLFYIFINVLENPADLNHFFLLAGAVLVPLTAVGLWQQAIGHPDSWGRWEIHSTLINSLVLAGFCLNWVFLFWDQTVHSKRFETVLFCLCIILLALSRSWWAAVCLSAGFAVYHEALIQKWYRKRRSTILALAGLAGLLSICLVIVKWHMHEGPYKGSSRFYYWWIALKAWEQEPWTGIGLGGFATAYPYFRTTQFQSTLYAHCFPLQWLSETGTLGMLSLLGLAWNLFRQSPKRTAPNASVAALKATLVSVILFSLLSINLEYLVNQIACAFLLAAYAWHYRPAGPRIKPLWVIVFSVSLWMLSPFWLRQFIGSQSYVRGNDYASLGKIEEAERYYLNAVSVDPFQADSYHALAVLCWRRFQETSQPNQRLAAFRWMKKALEYRKARDYSEELDFMTRSPGK